MKLTGIETESGDVKYYYEYSGSNSHLFKEGPLELSYDFDVSKVPTRILTIPFVAHAIPVSWAHNVEISVPEVDDKFQEILPAVRAQLDDFYPKVGFGRGESNIYEEDPPTHKEERSEEHTGCATFFSGGLDSFASYIQHREENPDLIFIRYKNLDRYNPDKSTFDPQYEKWVSDLTSFATSEDTNIHIIDAEYNQVAHRSNLNILHRESLSGYSWWQKVQHGLSHIAVSSPVLYENKIRTLYVPSSFTNEFDQGWATAPQIDNKIEWTGTACEHDLYDTSRQKKWSMIADFIQTETSGIMIRSCEPEPCGTCFGCARNIAGMAVADLNPNDFGYNVNEDTYNRIKNKIESNDWELDPVNEFFWKDIQSGISEEMRKKEENVPGEYRFCQWLKEVDLDEYTCEVPEELDLMKRVYREVLKKHPGYSQVLKMVYQRVT